MKRHVEDVLGRITSRSLGIIVVLSVFSSIPAAAQIVTLAEAHDQMMASDLELEILDLEENVAAELVRQARGERYPRVNLAINYLQADQTIVSQDNEAFVDGTSSYPTTTITFSITQPLYDPVRWRAMGVAQAEEALVAAQAEVARNQLSGSLLGAYLGVARAQLEVDQAETLVRARTQLERMLQLQADAGRVETDVVLRAQGDTFAARSDVSGAELDLSDALFELYRFTGPEVEGVRYSGGGAGIADVRQFIQSFSLEQLSEMSPALQVARAEILVAEKRLVRVRGSFRPTANLSIELQDEDTGGSLFGGSSQVQSTEIGLNINMSIYEGGIRRSRVREAETRIEISRMRLEQLEELTARRYGALISALDRSEQGLQTLGQEQRLANQRYNAALEQEDAGRVGPEVSMEARLRSDTLRLQSQASRLRSIQLQAEIYALFGALDIAALSRQFGQ